MCFEFSMGDFAVRFHEFFYSSPILKGVVLRCFLGKVRGGVMWELAASCWRVHFYELLGGRVTVSELGIFDRLAESRGFMVVLDETFRSVPYHIGL